MEDVAIRDPRTIDLLALKNATNAAIVVAGQDPICKDEACVNWADLRCVQAERYEDDSGSCGLRVWIEEASESNGYFRSFIATELRRGGYEVEVCTEW